MDKKELTEEQVSNYLKKNQDFLLRWLSENTTKEIVELFAKKLKDKKWDEVPAPPTKKLGRLQPPGGNDGLQPSVANTFPNTARNSITSQIFRRYLDGDRTRKPPVRKDRKSLQRMSEEELFMELIRDIASELDVNLLCHKILQNVSILTNSDRGSLFLVRGSRENKHLVSKLFDVTETSTLEDAIHTEHNEIKVPFGKGIVGIVAQSGKPINIKDAYEDPRFNQEIDRQTGYQTHSILSMPIVNYEGEVIGVAQIINKIAGNHEFTPQDEDLFRKYLIFCGIGITNAQLFEMSVNEFKRNQLLLHLARGIFQEQTNLEKLVQKIMLDAQDLLKCEKCCVYLLEDTCERDISRFTHSFLSRLGSYSRNSLVMSMQGLSLAGPTLGKSRMDAAKSQTDENRRASPVPETFKAKTPEEVVFSKAFDLGAKDGTVTVPSALVLASSNTAYIAKFVVTTGEPVNVADADADGRFGVGPFVDTNGNRIKSVLCMPIHNSEKNIIGVTQLINKVNGEPFNDNDVNIIEAFSIFTGLGIHNCQMYENACQLMAKQSVALEVLSFHATAHNEESNALSTAEIPKAEDLRLYTFDFDDMTMDDDGTLKASVRMFMEADIINNFKIPYEVVCRWLCTVKKNYRPVTYHNWRHAFNVCQTMFTMLFTGELRPMFQHLEVFTLLAACLCHDLDHRGTNNAFQVKVASPLAMLYSTSVLEHHHFDHCIMILNSEGNNIFQSLSPDEYRRAIKLLEHAILSTDLALYFKKRGDFKKLVESGERTFVEQPKRDLLRAMMMTACDVAAITKPWKIQQEIAQLVTAEFFEQGDIERHQLGEQPIPMMDRNKKDELPKMQVGFIDAICSPVYKMFSEQWGKLKPMLEGVTENRRHWTEITSLNELRPAVLAQADAPAWEKINSFAYNVKALKPYGDMTNKLDPLYNGCESNRQKWQEMSDSPKDKDEEEDQKKDKDQPPDTEKANEEKPAGVQVSSQSALKQGGSLQQVGPSDVQHGENPDRDQGSQQDGPGQDHAVGDQNNGPEHGEEQPQEGQPSPVAAASPAPPPPPSPAAAVVESSASSVDRNASSSFSTTTSPAHAAQPSPSSSTSATTASTLLSTTASPAASVANADSTIGARPSEPESMPATSDLLPKVSVSELASAVAAAADVSADRDVTSDLLPSSSKFRPLPPISPQQPAASDSALLPSRGHNGSSGDPPAPLPPVSSSSSAPSSPCPLPPLQQAAVHKTQSERKPGSATSSRSKGPAVVTRDSLSPTDGRPPSKLPHAPHQNGSVNSKQAKLGNNDPHHHMTQDAGQNRGKRKTHAQAHATASGDKSSSKKSGVCLVS